VSGRPAAAALALLLAAAVLGSAGPARLGPAIAAPPSTPPSAPPGVSSNAPPSASPNASGDLDALRQECIAAARDVQQREQTALALEHAIDLLRRDAEGRQRGLDESRVEQAHLLATLVYLARHPPARPSLAPEPSIDRIRGELLLQGTLPGLREEARALAAEIGRIAALRQQIVTQEGELASEREALGKDRERLAELTARRLKLTLRILPEDSGGDQRIAKLGRDASDIGDLIKRAEAAAERRDKELLGRARAALPKALKAMESALTADTADPTRPRALAAFDPPHSALQMPVSGTIVRRFGASDVPGSAGAATGTTGQGISVAAPGRAEAVAMFDGRVVYAGPFRNLGLVLIIRHGGLYHSLLAGLGRVDIKADQWVLAGEPVGAMPDAVDKASGGALYVELRRDGRPVDPQLWLGSRDQGRHPGGAPGPNEGRNEPGGDKKVRE
jgi:septal ring factor EnvC (AmiA/AmiB activator)